MKQFISNIEELLNKVNLKSTKYTILICIIHRNYVFDKMSPDLQKIKPFQPGHSDLQVYQGFIFMIRELKMPQESTLNTF